LLSIIIPTFNRCDLLQQTIESCLLNAKGSEIIVVDHGSQDQTAKIIRAKYAGKINYIRRERDYGPIFAWLDGLMVAKNEWVHMQFDDDLISMPILNKIKPFLHNDVGFVLSSAGLIDNSGLQLNYGMYENWFKTGIYSIKKIESLTMKKMISPGAVIIRKEDAINAFYQGQLPNQRYHYHGVGPDVMLTLLPQLKYSKFAFIDENLFQFREHSSSITNQAKKDQVTSKLFHFSYDEARKFYLGQKYLKRSMLFKIYCMMKLVNNKNIYLHLTRIRNNKWISLLDWLKKRLKKKS